MADTHLTRTRKLWRLLTYELTVSYLSHRIDQSAHTYEAARSLAALGRRFDRAGMNSMAMRCALMAATAVDEHIPAAARDECRTRRWHAEQQLALSKSTAVYLPLVL